MKMMIFTWAMLNNIALLVLILAVVRGYKDILSKKYLFLFGVVCLSDFFLGYTAIEAYQSYLISNNYYATSFYWKNYIAMWKTIVPMSLFVKDSIFNSIDVFKGTLYLGFISILMNSIISLIVSALKVFIIKLKK